MAIGTKRGGEKRGKPKFASSRPGIGFRGRLMCRVSAAFLAFLILPGLVAAQEALSALEVAAPFGNFSRPAAPRELAVTLGENLSLRPSATSYAFTRLVVDVPLARSVQSDGMKWGLRTRLPVAVQVVHDQDFTTGGLGNLAIESWFSSVRQRDRSRLTFGSGFGLILPAGLIARAETNAYFQLREETAPVVALYFVMDLYWQWARFDLMVDLGAGLGSGYNSEFASFAGSHFVSSLYYKVGPKFALTGGIVGTLELTSLTAGVRWRPREALELGAGISVPIASSYYVMNLEPLVQPMLEVKTVW